MSPDPVSDEALAAADDVNAEREIARNRPLTRPRPGPRRPGRHAEVRLRRRPARSSSAPRARETAARVALGEVAAQFLRQAYGIQLVSHTVAIGGAAVPEDAPCRPRAGRAARRRPGARPRPRRGPPRWSPRSRRPRGPATPSAGSSRCSAYGLPPGLGSHVHWDRRLDAQLAAALMGIQAIKGVEVGDGFRTAARRGSAAHDEMERDGRRHHPPAHRPSRRHRGWDVDRRRAAGPGRDEAHLAPCPRALDTIDTDRRGGRQGASTSAPTSARCPPPGWSPRRWSRSCWLRPASRSSAATRWPRPRATTRHTSPPSRPRCARGDGARPGPGRRDRAARRRQEHGRPAARRGPRRRLPRHRRGHRAGPGPADLRHLRGRGGARTSATSSAPRSRAALGGARGRARPRRRRADGPRRPRRPWPATPSSSSTSASRTPRAGSASTAVRPLLLGQPAGPVDQDDERAAPHLRAAGQRCGSTPPAASRTPVVARGSLGASAGGAGDEHDPDQRRRRTTTW